MEAAKDMQNTVVLVAGKILEDDVYKKLIEYEKKMLNLRVFTGWIPDNEMQIYFNASDIVVLPYTDITTSGVIPLAYAFSRPVVTTNIGGINSVVNENTGILVPPKDAVALKKAIDRIFTMDFEAMGRYAHEYAEREFSWGANAQKIKRLYESISA
jgi:glycosyltransferase involved in cell wall biosynthesis